MNDDSLAMTHGSLLKQAYYHLYSNSGINRSERLGEEFLKIIFSFKHLLKKDPQYREKIDVSSNLELEESLNEAFDELKINSSVFSESQSIILDGDSLREVVSLISKEEMNEGSSDLLAESFQTFIGYTARGEKGQFFTPKVAIRCICSILKPKKGELVIDPACGSGTFLSTSMTESEDGVDFIGMDIDSDALGLFRAFLEWKEQDTNSTFCINSLDIGSFPEELNDLVGQGVDVVMTNPPFGGNISVKDSNILGQYSLAKKWKFDKKKGRWEITNQKLKQQDPQILFIELCINLLKDGGRMGIVLPEGVIAGKSFGYVLDFLRDSGEITGLIDCPRVLFQPSTDTKTVILFFRKGKGTQETIWMACPETCGHDKRGRLLRNDKGEIENDFSHVASLWEREEFGSLGFQVEKGEIDPYFLLPRYYKSKSKIELKKLESEGEITLTTLGELIRRNEISIGRGIEPGSHAYRESGVPFIRTSDIINFGINSRPTKYVSSDVLDSFRQRSSISEGDLLFVADGRYRIGNVGILTKYDLDIVIQSHLKIIKCHSDTIDGFLLLYLLSHPLVNRQIRDLVVIQSTLGTIGKRIESIQLPIPNDDKRRREISVSVRKWILSKAKSHSNLESMHSNFSNYST